MGTRADFYVGIGEKAEWLGSIAMDGYPDGFDEEPRIFLSQTEEKWRRSVKDMIDACDYASKPEQGWPWPWDNSHLTDFSYTWNNGEILCSHWGSTYIPIEKALDEDFDWESLGKEKIAFPDMKERRRITWGKRSGLIVVGPKGIIDEE